MKKEPLISTDGHLWPGWAPDWLRANVEMPDCSSGTHIALRALAKWLTIYFAEHPGGAKRWLYHAAQFCDRVPDDAELDRLLSWAGARFADGDYDDQDDRGPHPGKPTIDIERIYDLVISGPTLGEFRELSPVRLYDTGTRNTPIILEAWAHYARQLNPWVCYGSKDCFYTRRLVDMRERASAYEQIVPSPMRDQYGLTIDGRLSQHSLDGTGPRLCLVAEFDFAPVNKKREPTIWAPLITRCKAAGRSVLDMNAALCAHLRSRGPLWMTAYSGGKSLQAWFPCRDLDEALLLNWFRNEALMIGACPSTWTRFQFVRMPDGERDDGRRQSVEYYDPNILSLGTEKEGAAYR
jgi:hypothetical protein